MGVSRKIAVGGCLSGLQPTSSVLKLKEMRMLSWAGTFFVIAIIAAIFGFGGIASGAADIAKVLFFVFLVVFFISLITGLMSGRRARSD
jgi:uncharacterized membrane protein YtjA (UPF0391 family)